MNTERLYRHGLYARYTQPSELRAVLEKYPLDKKAVDWVREQGIQIVVGENGFKGSFSWVSLRIGLRKDILELGEEDITVVHELHHVIVPGLQFDVDEKHGAYENLLDEMSLPLSQDSEFMNYVKTTIPYICPLLKRRAVFPNLPLGLKIQYIK